MARVKRASWTRQRMESKLTLYYFPRVVLRASAQGKGWNWRVSMDSSIVALGDAPTRDAAERAAVGKIKEMLKKMERSCP